MVRDDLFLVGGSLPVFDALGEDELRAAGSLEWARYAGALGAFVAERDFRTAPVVTRAHAPLVPPGAVHRREGTYRAWLDWLNSVSWVWGAAPATSSWSCGAGTVLTGPRTDPARCH